MKINSTVTGENTQKCQRPLVVGMIIVCWEQRGRAQGSLVGQWLPPSIHLHPHRAMWVGCPTLGQRCHRMEQDETANLRLYCQSIVLLYNRLKRFVHRLNITLSLPTSLFKQCNQPHSVLCIPLVIVFSHSRVTQKHRLPSMFFLLNFLKLLTWALTRGGSKERKRFHSEILLREKGHDSQSIYQKDKRGNQ